MKRNASAHWEGTIKEGNGRMSSESGVLADSRYSFGTRFEDDKGTNPEELIAAAHAGCFSMALSMLLGNAGLTPESIDTKATVTLEQVESGFGITKIHLDVTAKVPEADNETFQKAANDAKGGCPVSKVLNATISMEARLEN